MSWFSCFSLPAPTASPGPGAEGLEFLGVGAREGELDVMPPPPPHSVSESKARTPRTG